MRGDKSQLISKFGDRVSFDKTEMQLYSHDAASLPGIVRQLINNVPEAVVQPIDIEELVYIVKFAQKYGIPLTPRGGATSGHAVEEVADMNCVTACSFTLFDHFALGVCKPPAASAGEHE